jgi:hypothetical protein
MVTMIRFWGDTAIRRRPDPPPSEDLTDRIRQVLLDRVSRVDEDALESIERYFDHVLRRWSKSPPPRYGNFGPPEEEVPLMYPYGSEPLPAWNALAAGPPWPTPSSMRNVDATCELGVVPEYYVPDDRGTD